MSFIPSTPGGEMTPLVEDAPATGPIAADRIESRVRGDLPEDVLISAHQAQVSFFEHEVRQGEKRGMPADMVALHEHALKTHMAALVTLGAAEWIPEFAHTA